MSLKFKRPLILVLVLVLALSAVTGGTIAWFTDEVTSANNVIQSGSLDLELEYLDDNNTWQKVTEQKEPLFNYQLWEPGYTQLRQLKLTNAGDLAFKFELNILPNEEAKAGETNLADVIEVYYGMSETAPANLAEVKAGTLAGTLSALAVDEDGAAHGVLLPKGETSTTYPVETIPMWIALHMKEEAGNEYQNLSVGNGFGLKLLATQFTYEADSFDDQYDAEATYPGAGIAVTPSNVASIDFTQENQTFRLAGEFGALAIAELGEGSVLSFEDAKVGALTLNDDAVLSGKATIESFTAVRNNETPIDITLNQAEFDVNGDINVKNTLGKSVLNINNSHIDCAFLFVGEHTNNALSALAELNINNSYLRCEENSLGSTISVWGRSGVKATIHDSEIHTYSRGWHSSEDANDNAITFQGATSIDVDIQRSNIHTYGYRSIINARQYGSEATDINCKMDDSLIWVVTKSTHNPETIPVWGFNSITDTAMIFTKNVAASTDEVVDSSFIMGNPVIHGNFQILSNCNCSWDAHAILSNGTVTFASDANITIAEECKGSLTFVLSDQAKVVVENGAVLTNIDIMPAEGYTLNTVTENGSTIYTVTKN